MNIKSFLCLGTAVLLVTSVTASAQSLVDLANQEKQRRARLRSSGGPAKLYTENERTGVPIDVVIIEGGAAVGTATVAVAAPAGKKEKSADELAAEKQKEWAERLQKAQDEIRDTETVIARNERALASMFNITPARADLATSIETDKKKLADLRQSLVALEDERRRAGMPRGR